MKREAKAYQKLVHTRNWCPPLTSVCIKTGGTFSARTVSVIKMQTSSSVGHQKCKQAFCLPGDNRGLSKCAGNEEGILEQHGTAALRSPPLCAQ